MDDREKRSVFVYLIALSVILSNLIVLSVLYQVPFLSDVGFIRRALPLISLAAVYPFEMFQHYMKETLEVHFFWIAMVMASAFGLLFYLRLSRTVFIFFNILQYVLLGVIASQYVNQFEFWGYFFKGYFNLVVFLLYVGYLTLPEIRQQFVVIEERKKRESLLLRLRRRTLSPKDADGYFNLAVAYVQLGRTDEAVDFLNRAIRVVPDKAEYHFMLGKILFDRLDYSAAINSLREAVRLDPIHVQARYLLGAAFQRTGCLEEAVQMFRRCILLEPLKEEMFRALGIACFHAGHLDEAEGALRKAGELEPRSSEPWYFLGLIAARDPARMKDAEEYFKKAVKLAPESIGAYRELGHIYVASGDYKSAVRAFRDVLRLDPHQSQAHYQLGFSYAMLKDYESARREHKVLRDMDPDLAQTLGMMINRA